MRKLHLLAAGTVVAGAAAAVAVAAPLSTGPSTTTAPYVLPKAQGVSITSLLTTGDSVGSPGYRMVGIPDALGAYEDRSEGKNSVVVLMNHELNAGSGVVRAHGQKGAFVSRWVIDSKTLEVKSGKDLIKSGVKYYNYATGLYDGAASAFARFCSGSLTEEGQFFARGVGTKERIYFANEENGNGGRLFGVSMSGEAQQLPRLGLFSWENTLAAQNKSKTTLVHGTEDASPGELWVYVGEKTNTGNAFDKAGLTNGVNHVLKVSGIPTDAAFRAAYDVGDKVPFELAEVDWNNSDGNAQNAAAVAAGGLGFNRMEDGAWDPKHPNVFYFITTDGGQGTVNTGRGGGLWRVTYKDIEKPELGGTLELLLDGSESIQLNKPDNMGIDRRGNIMIQEDPGNQDPLPAADTRSDLARIVAYRIKDGALGVVAQFDPVTFDISNKGTAAFITQDEESSGIIPADDLFGKKTWLFDAQVHKASADTELVEGGQLLLLKVKSYKDVYGGGDGEDDEG